MGIVDKFNQLFTLGKRPACSTIRIIASVSCHENSPLIKSFIMSLVQDSSIITKTRMQISRKIRYDLDQLLQIIYLFTIV